MAVLRLHFDDVVKITRLLHELPSHEVFVAGLETLALLAQATSLLLLPGQLRHPFFLHLLELKFDLLNTVLILKVDLVERPKLVDELIVGLLKDFHLVSQLPALPLVSLRRLLGCLLDLGC